MDNTQLGSVEIAIDKARSAVGAIGASGGTAQQDGQVAKAGADTIK